MSAVKTSLRSWYRRALAVSFLYGPTRALVSRVKRLTARCRGEDVSSLRAQVDMQAQVVSALRRELEMLQHDQRALAERVQSLEQHGHHG